ncbi:MAG TPA: 2-phosphosulfolactate phosphatase [Chthoniobacteraceae bacterium]|jgi:2-phosphosulfolactate phosphatase
MIIDVALNPAEIALLPQRDLSGTTCVVFDVLRATSSIITALAHGAAAIHPARTIDEALALKAVHPAAILGGERHGDLIPGFDLGNAPTEYLEVAGREIITTTTNGTIALRACEGAQRVLVGALLNLAAIAEEIRRTQPQRILLVCAGTFEDFALEDACAAGCLIRNLPEAQLTDSAEAAAAIAKSFPSPLETLRASQNGRVLISRGRAAEVEWCARLSVFKVVGSMESAVIRPLPL